MGVQEKSNNNPMWLKETRIAEPKEEKLTHDPETGKEVDEVKNKIIKITTKKLSYVIDYAE